MKVNQFQKPEAALQRAQEFISVGKEQEALNSLHDMIKDRRHKQWTQTHEQIMLKYVELCVNLKNSSIAKDGLHQYKVLTQQVALKSLEVVLDKFLRLAELKTEEAQKASIEKVEEIDDLDIADAPENLLLSVVSGAVPQDRMDRTVLSPWLRFLWDSYRNCLDMLRNNVYVEQLYHQIARQSFAFCAKYQRRNEFRKLCDLLRLHLSQIQKSQVIHAADNFRIKLTNVESLALMQETRLIQLDTAIQMELWQEAYKSAEDLHNMMQLIKDKEKKIVKPASYGNYYDKLALVFWKGGNTLFHAASLLQKYNIYKDLKKSFTDEEATEQSTRLLLATLSIPEGADSPSILTKHLDIEDQHLNNIRVLSALLRLPIAPTRAGILKEIVRLSISELAIPTVQKLYKDIEVDFNPLGVAGEVQTALVDVEAMNRDDLSQYVSSIKTSVATKVLKQITVIYDSLRLERFVRIIPFYNATQLERFFVEVSKRNSVKAQIDHRAKCVHFGPVDPTLAGDVEHEDDVTAEFGLQSIQGHIESIYDKLNNVSYDLKGAELFSGHIAKLKRHVNIYKKHKDVDYEHILMRRKKIESYKENSENVRQERILQAQAEANQKEEKRRAEELKRLAQENKENEKRRKLAEQDEIQKKINQDRVKRIQANPIYQQILRERGEQSLENMDPDAVLAEQRQRMDAERRELQLKLQQQEKKFDHLIRAFHLEEAQVRKAISEERRAKAPELFNKYEEIRIQKAEENHKKSFITFEHLTNAKADAILFLRGVIADHAEETKVQMERYEANLKAVREAKLKERALARKEQRRRDAEEKVRQEQQRAAAASARPTPSEREGASRSAAMPGGGAEKEQWRQQTRNPPPIQSEKENRRPVVVAPVAAAATVSVTPTSTTRSSDGVWHLAPKPEGASPWGLPNAQTRERNDPESIKAAKAGGTWRVGPPAAATSDGGSSRGGSNAPTPTLSIQPVAPSPAPAAKVGRYVPPQKRVRTEM